MTRRRSTLYTLWNATLALLGVALLGSAWAAFFSGECASCGGTFGNAGGRVLAQAGVLYYLILLGAGISLGPSRFVWRGVLVAASVHAALLMVLVTRGTLCPPCLLAGAAAIGAAVVACVLEPYNVARASIILPAVALVTQVAVFAVGPFPGAEASVRKALPAESRPTSPGTARMVVYERIDCVFCRRLRDEVLPPLRREFAERLEVEFRPADDLPGLPTPTIILSGAGGRRSFPGLPGGDVLRQAILETLGDSHDRQAMLPPSR